MSTSLQLCLKNFKLSTRDIYDPRSKIQALRNSLQPTTQDQKNEVSELYEVQKKGPKRINVDKWLNQWTLVVRAKKLNIDNLLGHQICEGFIESAKDINPIFYGAMKSRSMKNNKDRAILEKIHQLISALVTERLPSTYQRAG
jgi:hypothetical protein